MKFKAVIFDLGGVIVDDDFTKDFFRLYATRVQEEGPYEEIFRRFEEEPVFISYATGQISPEIFCTEICTKMDLELSFDDFRALWCDVLKFKPDMEALLAEVYDHIPVGILSDIDILTWKYLYTNRPILRKIAKPTLSFEIGTLKPNPNHNSFYVAAANVGFLPEECIFIDDRPINLEGARQVGMYSILFKDIDSLRAELVTLGILP